MSNSVNANHLTKHPHPSAFQTAGLQTARWREQMVGLRDIG
ncbi:hypothetical protein [Scytonema sp. UIC 10036]|nr:hypothetical protein [Scytonema sp. UIC 10036]